MQTDMRGMRGDPADMMARVGRAWGWVLAFGIITLWMSQPPVVAPMIATRTPKTFVSAFPSRSTTRSVPRSTL